MKRDHVWRGGDRVEVVRVVSGAAVYFPANVVNAASVRKTLVWVEHEYLMVGRSFHMKEYVTPTRIRPTPPRELSPRFEAGDDVDVFRDSEGCWVRGNVTALLGNSRYIVKFNGCNRQDTEVNHFYLRLHREWVDGSWLPSFTQQGNDLESMPRNIKLKIKFTRRDEYEKGAIVEVKSGEEAAASWYCARIVCLVGEDKYIVQHLRFSRDNDDSIPLRDLVDAQNLRPVPPQELSPVSAYEPGDEVDAWFNKRWWVGKVSNVLRGGSKYSVYFISTSKESIVPHFNLRPHKEWINGQWINPSKLMNDLLVHEECYKPPLKKLKSCKGEEMLFDNGMMVEVRSDEQGYEGSWFSAKIINYLGKNRYTVEYQTLKTEDERELLKEEARGSDIRPNPPPMVQGTCHYELNEDVDAWFNDGWWSGRVYKVTRNHMRYGVYFKTTDEKLEFAYDELRPCLLWKNGKWTRA